MVDIHRGPRKTAHFQSAHLAGNRLLRPIQRREKNTTLVINGVIEQHLASDFLGDGLFDNRCRNFQQLDREGHQVLVRQAAVAFRRGFGQRIGNTGLRTQGRILGDANLLGNGVCRQEANTPNIARQPIGIFPDHGNRILTVGLENPHRP